MQTYELLVEGRSVRSNSYDNTLVRTSIGIDQIHVMFDNREWLDFPLTVTFAQKGVDPVTTSLVVRALSNSSEWAAEATVTIPYEVIGMVGPIRVTFQGTDSGGNHIITAKGAPLTVEEAGDVTLGHVPEDAPTVDQWQQAYADAMQATNAITTLANEFEADVDERIASIVADATQEIAEVVDSYRRVATSTQLGHVKVGSGINVADDGTISAAKTNGITDAQASQIANLAALAATCFVTSFDDDGVLEEGATVAPAAIPVDGTTIRFNDDGKLELAATFGDGVGY